MKLKKELSDMKKWIILVLIGVFSFWGLNNIFVIGNIVSKIYKVLFPFILGGIITFVLNIPMTKIENKLKKKIKGKNDIIRALSIIISLFLLILAILFIALLLIPELVENITMLISNIPSLIENLEVFIIDLLDKYPDVQLKIEELFTTTLNISNVVSDLLNYFITGSISFISNLVSSFVTIFTSIIFSIYMLSQKEYLLRGSKKIIYACFNKNKADKLVKVGKLANKTFSKFISGQCVDAIILGVIIFIVSLIFRFPYALIISVLTAITALVPIFGAMIAMFIGAILIAITNPLQAVLFIIIFQVVQQIEGNFIYPKIVGKSVGLTPMWTLFAITIGGSLFGISGMIIGIPLASIIYTIIKALVNDKLSKRQIKIN